jgi:N-sulfoglucosamine sulfohydrolase
MNAARALAVSLLFVGLLSEGHPAEPTRGSRPNLVLVVADDLGLTLGCYGDAVARTPNLDQLAKEGVRFTQAFCTTASCSPSRSVLLTGRHNHATGQYGLQHSVHHFEAFADTPTLPALLKRSGYRTVRIGKLHVGPDAAYPFDRVLKAGPGGDRNTVALAERVEDYLREPAEPPFFLYFCPTDPHRSGTVNTNSPHRPDRFGNGPAYPGVREVAFDPASVRVPPFLPDTPACRAELAEYYQSVARFDQGIGRLVRALKDTGHYDRTVLVVLSDNGIAFPGAKTTLYEPGMQLPLIVRVPQAERRGSTNNALVSWVDVTPTLLDFAGALSTPRSFHGRSFRAVLEQERPAGWEVVFGSHTFHEVTMYYPMRVVRTRGFKLIHNLAHPLSFPFASDLYSSATWQQTLAAGAERYGQRRVQAYLHRPPWELYDLQNDPHEIQNLAADPAHQAMLRELQSQLRRFQTETQDPWIVKYEHE